VVELPGKIDKLLSFDIPELQAAAKFGVWFDASTLVVVFTECVNMGKEDSPEAEKDRPVYIMFEAERGMETAKH
jgi:hypothetical protein